MILLSSSSRSGGAAGNNVAGDDDAGVSVDEDEEEEFEVEDEAVGPVMIVDLIGRRRAPTSFSGAILSADRREPTCSF